MTEGRANNAATSHTPQIVATVTRRDHGIVGLNPAVGMDVSVLLHFGVSTQVPHVKCCTIKTLQRAILKSPILARTANQCLTIQTLFFQRKIRFTKQLKT